MDIRAILLKVKRVIRGLLDLDLRIVRISVGEPTLKYDLKLWGT
jgi:molybdenum cofactor biosynthesis enzyme MoaA